MEKEIKHLNDLLDGALKEKEEAELKIEKAIEYIKTDAFWISQLEAEQKLLEILGDKEDE